MSEREVTTGAAPASRASKNIVRRVEEKVGLTGKLIAWFAVMATEKAVKLATEGAESMRSTASQAEEISRSTQQQKSASDQVSEAIAQTREGVEQVVGAQARLSESAQSLDQTATGLTTLLRRFGGSEGAAHERGTTGTRTPVPAVLPAGSPSTQSHDGQDDKHYRGNDAAQTAEEPEVQKARGG